MKEVQRRKINRDQVQVSESLDTCSGKCQDFDTLASDRSQKERSAPDHAEPPIIPSSRFKHGRLLNASSSESGRNHFYVKILKLDLEGAALDLYLLPEPGAGTWYKSCD
jgi:hypothetical protein